MAMKSNKLNVHVHACIMATCIAMDHGRHVV